MNKNRIKEIFQDFNDFSEHYQLDDEVLDFYAEQICNLDNQECGLSIEEACKEFGLNKKMLEKAQRLGIFNTPLSNLDKAAIELLAKLWAKAWFLRPQLMRFKKDERVRLLDAPEFSNLWERRVYYWYLGQPEGLKDERNQSHTSTTLTVKTVLTALLHYYPSVFSEAARQWMHELMRKKGMSLFEPVESKGKVGRRKRKPPTSFLSLKTRIENIRKAAQSKRSYLKKKGMTHEDILKSRGIKETDLRRFMNTHRKFSYDPASRAPEDIFDANDKPRM